MEKRKELIINVLFVAMVCGLLYLFMNYLFPALVPFLIAFIVACIVRFFAKKISKDSDQVGTRVAVIIILGFYTLLFVLAILLGVNLVDKIGEWVRSMPDMYNETIVPLWQQLSVKMETMAMEFDESVAREVERTLNEFQTNMGTIISNASLTAVRVISGGITGIPAFIIKLIVTVIATFFMTVDFDKITKAFRNVVGEKKYGLINQGVHQAKDVVFAYLKSYIILFFLTFIELSIGLSIMRIPYSILVALGIAVFDILPILGTGGILIPWSIICLFIDNIPMGIGIFVLYIVIAVVRNSVEPRIVGKQIGLHPLVTLIAMFVGLSLFGLVGLLGVPIVLVVLVNMGKAGVIDWKWFSKVKNEKKDTEGE